MSLIWVEAVCGDSERGREAALRKGPEGSAERGQKDGDAKPTDVKKYRSRLGGKVLWEGRGTEKKKRQQGEINKKKNTDVAGRERQIRER